MKTSGDISFDPLRELEAINTIVALKSRSYGKKSSPVYAVTKNSNSLNTKDLGIQF